MDRETVIASLRPHQAELREMGIVKLSLFGSVARQDAAEDSDIDLAAIFAEGPRGFAHLERKDRIKARLEELLGRPVDLIEEPSSAPRVQQEIDRDRVLVAPDRTGQALVDVLVASPLRDINRAAALPIARARRELVTGIRRSRSQRGHGRACPDHPPINLLRRLTIVGSSEQARG